MTTRLVRTVAELSQQWRQEGRFTRQEARDVLVAAARSDIGRGAPARRLGMNTIM